MHRVQSSADGAPDYAVRHLAWGNRAAAAVGCSLSGPSALEVAVVRATGTLELWASAPSGLAPALLCETRLQCRVRALRAARPPGRKGDVLLLLSDAGRLCVLAAQRSGDGAVELVCVGSMAAAPEDFGVTLSPTSEPAPPSRRCARAAHRQRVQAPSR